MKVALGATKGLVGVSVWDLRFRLVTAMIEEELLEGLSLLKQTIMSYISIRLN